MAPKLSEDEVDDLIYLARAGEKDELEELISTLAEREDVSAADILAAAKDEGKSTCLHMATGNGNIEIVTLLLRHLSSRPQAEKQAFLDAPNEYGNTGLHWAALGGHLEIVRVLLAAGATPALANDKNYVPLDLAGLNCHLAVVDYFLAQAEAANAEDGLDEAVGEVRLTAGEAEEGEEGKSTR